MKPPSFHVLNFFYDDENSCALTIVAHKTRFHIIADVSNLGHEPKQDESPSNTLKEYTQLLDKYKASTEDGRPESQDGSTDSAIEMATPRPGTKSKKTSPNDAAIDLYRWLASPLEPHVAALEQHNNTNSAEREQETLEDWYQRRPSRYFNLEAHKAENDDNDNDEHVEEHEVRAVELDAAPDLVQRMSRLCPELAPVPKHIRALDDVPWYAAGSLAVLRCSTNPPPYHPSIVEMARPGGEGTAGGDDGERRKQFFFKPVDNSDPDPTVREIELLHRISGIEGLHEKIRCPRLEGIVMRRGGNKDDDDHRDGGSGDRGSIMGILQTVIVDPTPLTEMFDTAVAQEDRERWAREAEAMKEALHEHGIVWGDAKGDNFVVDAEGELWIIDFGGSYTEGWVDPEMADTKEGDDMGVEKVVNALHDPVNNVAAASDDERDSDEDVVESEASSNKAEKKRKRAKSREGVGSKRQKRKKAKSPIIEEPKYCYCDGISSGTMIGCDGDDCEKEWFHVDCVGLEKMPAKEESWFCRDCATT